MLCRIEIDIDRDLLASVEYSCSQLWRLDFELAEHRWMIFAINYVF